MIKFLLKGLLRDRSRSLFPILTVMIGAFLTVFLFTYMKGAMGSFVQTAAKFQTGYVKVLTKASAQSIEGPNLELALLDITELQKTLAKARPEMIWTPRINFGGLLDVPDAQGETLKQAPIFGIGLNLLSESSREKEILNIEKSIVTGALPKQPNDVLLSHELATKLQVKPGDQITLISSTAQGSFLVHTFHLVGTVQFGVSAMDRGAMIADLSEVQFAFDLNDGVSEILGFTPDLVYDDQAMVQLAKEFNTSFQSKQDEFSPLMLSLGEQNGLDQMLAFADAAGSIMIGVFVFAMGIVLWNSGLLGSIRRYGEVGIRLAIGESKGKLYGSMLLESILIGFIGSILGTILGLALSFYLQNVGLDISSSTRNASMMIDNVLRAKVTPFSYIIGFFPGLFAPLLGTAIAGIGIFKRQTSQLFKELEV